MLREPLIYSLSVRGTGQASLWLGSEGNHRRLSDQLVESDTPGIGARAPAELNPGALLVSENCCWCGGPPTQSDT